MSSVTVIVGTFGDEATWKPLADRAVESAVQQTVLPDEVLWVHRDTLQEARNTGAEMAASEWLIFLDADDELDSQYIESMLRAPGDLRRPMTIGVYEDGSEDDAPIFIPRKPLLEANFIVIGAMVKRSTFIEVGGFRELPCLEDWDLWLRVVINGASVADAHGAIYRVSVNDNGRNHHQDSGRIYNAIQREYRPFKRVCSYL